MGIKRNDLLRCANKKELLQGSGTGNINSATVTVVFDNTDKDKSPPEQKNQDEIKVQRNLDRNGIDHQEVNGRNASLAEVKKLFLTVRINIDNPHFMVMQNQVVKISQMKPKEVLSLLEESVGTKFQDDSIRNAKKDIEKKTPLFEEVCRRIDEELLPEIEVQERKIKDQQDLKAAKIAIEDCAVKEICLSWQREDDTITEWIQRQEDDQHAVQGMEKDINDKEETLRKGKKECDDKKYQLEETMQKELDEMKSKGNEQQQN